MWSLLFQKIVNYAGRQQTWTKIGDAGKKKGYLRGPSPFAFGGACPPFSDNICKCVK